MEEVKFNDSVRSPVNDALNVWNMGVDYFDENEIPDHILDGECEWEQTKRMEGYTFTGIDYKAYFFLKNPELQRVRTYTCCRMLTPYEDALVKTLEGSDSTLQLQALMILIKLNSISKVDRQIEVLREMSFFSNDGTWTELISILEREVSREIIFEILKSSLSKLIIPQEAHWAALVAGHKNYYGVIEIIDNSVESKDATGCSAMIQCLKKLNIEQANQVIAKFLMKWDRPTVVSDAAYALIDRDKNLLIKKLLEPGWPNKFDSLRGLFLGRCDRSECVPMLCKVVVGTAIVDGEMLRHIGKLAREEHRSDLESCVDRIRDKIPVIDRRSDDLHVKLAAGYKSYIRRKYDMAQDALDKLNDRVRKQTLEVR